MPLLSETPRRRPASARRAMPQRPQRVRPPAPLHRDAQRLPGPRGAATSRGAPPRASLLSETRHHTGHLQSTTGHARRSHRSSCPRRPPTSAEPPPRRFHQPAHRRHPSASGGLGWPRCEPIVAPLAPSRRPAPQSPRGQHRSAPQRLRNPARSRRSGAWLLASCKPRGRPSLRPGSCGVCARPPLPPRAPLQRADSVPPPPLQQRAQQRRPRSAGGLRPQLVPLGCNGRWAQARPAKSTATTM
mmetsp:Transcript_32100/g.88486  ORF Transcript_32100/g.88486 Transcript_32100/m.88486 type:complete len:244 (+) Transcript_32100:359-1090(+)